MTSATTIDTMVVGAANPTADRAECRRDRRHGHRDNEIDDVQARPQAEAEE
jgi:hypothetical protein